MLNRLVSTIVEEDLPQANVASEARRTLCSSSVNFRRRAGNRTWDSTTFVDLMKAFYSVRRTVLWLIPKRLGCPSSLLQMVILLHPNQRDQIRLNGYLSEPFSITDGVKQGCVILPTLFSILFKHDPQASN